MVKKTLFSSLILLTLILSCKPSKEETLDHIRLCLEAQNETSVLFNKRNPYLHKIVEAIKNENNQLNKSNFTKIDSLNIRIHESIILYLTRLEIEKSKFQDKTLTNGMIDYLIAVKNFEIEFDKFLSLIKDSIQDNEEELSLIINKLAHGLNSETRKLNRIKSGFYERHSIQQKEIDSVVELIRK